MCNITVDLAEKRTDSIRIRGTIVPEGSEVCSNASIGIVQISSSNITTSVINNTWEVTFTSNEVPNINSVSCPRIITVDVQCVETSTCRQQIRITLECVDDPCPTVSLSVTDTSQCNDGQQAVTYQIDVGNAPNPTILEINYGDGEDEIIDNSDIQNSHNNPITKQHTYTTGIYAVVVNTIFPENCPSSNTVSVDVQCDVDCPDDIVFEIIDANGNRFKILDNVNGPYEQINDNPNGEQVECLPSGDYTLRIVEPNGSGLGFTWREGEDPPVTTNQRDFDFQLNDAEEKTITATITKDGCPPLPEAVVVKACGCEATDWSEWSECVDCVQTRTRTLSDCTVETETRRCSSPPTEFSEWTPSGFCSQTRSRRNENCVIETQSRIEWCCVWGIANIILFIATAIFILVSFCMLPATFWSAIAALGSGGTLAAVWAALTAVNITLLIVSAALLSASIVSYILWLIFCVFLNERSAACRLLSTLIMVLSWLTVISTIVAIALTIIAMLCAANIFCLFQALGCAAGAWIDVAWLGAILGITEIISFFLCDNE